jgi:DNA-binding NarL/FixJ family response regulator
MIKKSIFIAEGENHVRTALRLMLDHQADFVIAGEANHTESLLAQVCQDPPDVILLDWNLPGINPPRLLRTIRDYCPATQLIAVSVKPEDKKIVRELGTNAFISKQLPPDQFLAELRKSIIPCPPDQVTDQSSV